MIDARSLHPTCDARSRAANTQRGDNHSRFVDACLSSQAPRRAKKTKAVSNRAVVQRAYRNEGHEYQQYANMGSAALNEGW